MTHDNPYGKTLGVGLRYVKYSQCSFSNDYSESTRVEPNEVIYKIAAVVFQTRHYIFV